VCAKVLRSATSLFRRELRLERRFTAFIPLWFLAFALVSPALASSQDASNAWAKYVSKDGGFELAAAGEVKESTSGQIRNVNASVKFGAVRTYSASASFFPVSMGNREDTEENFSKMSTYPSCTELRVEKTEFQGLPAREVHGKCGNSRFKHLGVWVFAGNRIFTFDEYMSPLARERDMQRLLATFKIADARFISRGEWTTFESEGGFSVSLPGFPVHLAQSSPRGTGYFLENYALGAMALPPSSGKPSERFEFRENETQAFLHGIIIKRTDTTYNGLPARRFELSYQRSNERFIKTYYLVLGSFSGLAFRPEDFEHVSPLSERMENVEGARREAIEEHRHALFRGSISSL